MPERRDQAVTTAYNEQGQVAQVTDARGIVTRYEYNGFGEVIKLISQDTGTTTYAYDSAGNKVQQQNANGIVTQYRYDALNRLLAVEYPASPAENIVYQYDVANLNAVGRMAKVQDQTGATERAYDSRGNVVHEVRTIGNQRYSMGYEYDSAGNLSAMTYPNGVTIRYQQDGLGRVQRISRVATLGDDTLLDNIRYLPFGPVSSLRYGNGLTDQRAHDLDYRLHSQRLAGLYQKSYQYDSVGNITAILDQHQAANDKHYEYDELNRLTISNTGLGNREQFGYDAVGNRIAYQQVANGDIVTQQAYQYADTSNRLLSVQQGAVQRAFEYDNAGNTVQDNRVDGEQRALQYGANNRLQAVAKDGLPTARYQHNAQGQRVIKVVNGEETHFIYDINDRLIAEASGDGQIQRQYVYLGRVPVAMQDAANDQWYFVHNDHLGTPKLVTDSDANVVWRGEANAFGETEESGSLTFAFRFPGQVDDGESGYFYNYFRDYDSSVGRYLQSDPIGLTGGLNTYAYSRSNPVILFDENGLDPQIYFMRELPPNSSPYTTQSGKTFWTPQGTNFNNVLSAGQSISGLSMVNPARIVQINNDIGHFGTFDFQRLMMPDGQSFLFIGSYTDAANYGVGVYMQGAGYSLEATHRIAGGFAQAFSSNAGDPAQKEMWKSGWNDAKNGKLDGMSMCPANP